MPTITAAQLAEIRDHIGEDTPPTDDTLTGYFDELGTTNAVALRVLRRRLASMLAKAADFQADGDYRESWAKNIDKLEKKIATLEASAATDAVTSTSSGTLTSGLLVRDNRCR